MTVSSTMRYPPATVNNRRNAKSRSMCPDHVPWSLRVKRSWETLSNASAIAEQVVTLLKYSNAMRYIHSGSGIESYLPKEILCLFLCGLPPLRISCNFCTPHESLSSAPKTTPAMAAGSTDHGWTMHELLSFHVPPPRWAPPKRRGRPSRALQHLIAQWCA